MMLIYTAARWNELLGISIDDVNTSILTIKRSKKGRDPHLPLIGDAEAILSHWGTMPHLTTSQFNKRVKDVCRYAGIDNWAMVSSHVGRHTLSTLMQKAGAPDSIRGALLGHYDGSVTTVYAHQTNTTIREWILRGLGKSCSFLAYLFHFCISFFRFIHPFLHLLNLRRCPKKTGDLCYCILLFIR